MSPIEPGTETAPRAAASITLPQTLKAGVPAGVIAVLVSIALRATDVDRPVRIGISFAVFVILHAVLWDRVTNTSRGRARWVATLILAAVGAAVMSFIAAV